MRDRLRARRGWDPAATHTHLAVSQGCLWWCPGLQMRQPCAGAGLEGCAQRTRGPLCQPTRPVPSHSECDRVRRTSLALTLPNSAGTLMSTPCCCATSSSCFCAFSTATAWTWRRISAVGACPACWAAQKRWLLEVQRRMRRSAEGGRQADMQMGQCVCGWGVGGINNGHHVPAAG